MTIILSEKEANQFKEELSIQNQEDLDSLISQLFKDASEFIDAELCEDGTIKLSGSEVYIMNVFSAMRDKIAYIAGIKSIGIGTIKTAMTLISDIKRDYKVAVEKSKIVSKQQRRDVATEDIPITIDRSKIRRRSIWGGF